MKKNWEELLERVAEGEEGAAYTMAYVVASSVLKRCCQVAWTPALESLRVDLHRSWRDPTDAGAELDLVHVAYIAIREQLEEGRVDLEESYTVTRLRRRVHVNTPTSQAWETVETCGLREVYRAVRRAVSDMRSVRVDPRSKCCYLEDVTTNPDTGKGEDVYIRLGKYSDMGGYVVDYNGVTTAYTVDRESAHSVGGLIHSLDLTRRQEEVLQMRLAGYGVKAIATALGVRKESVRSCLTCVQKKVMNSDSFQPYLKKTGLK